ncbi:Nin1 binding protein, partial [Thoreauomyces humboldtii]
HDAVHTLIIDSAPLIKNTPISHLATRFVTIPEVVSEIRDKAARENLARLPYDLETRVPSDESLAAVVAFAKRTGDYGVLSAVDLKVLALTWMMQKETAGVDHLRTEPVPKGQAPGPGGDKRKRRRNRKKTAKKDDADEEEDVEDEDEVEVEQRQEQPLATSDDVDDGETVDDADLVEDSDSEAEVDLDLEDDDRQEETEDGPTDAEIAEAQARLAQISLSHHHHQRQQDQQHTTSTPSTSESTSTSTSTSTPRHHASVIAPVAPSTTAPASSVADTEEWTPARSGRNRKQRPAVRDLGDEEGWITPANVKKHKAKDGSATATLASNRNKETIPVACITSDFAMQNVLLQMGLRLLSVDGVAIEQVKSFVLRCHACFKITKAMDKKFCPSCGNNTLIRTTVGVDSNGKVTYYLKKNFQYNNRGTKFNIPEAKGGRRANDMMLREDQREYQRAVNYQRRAKETMDAFDLDYVPLDAQKTIPRNNVPTIGHGRKNVNVAKKERQKRR